MNYHKQQAYKKRPDIHDPSKLSKNQINGSFTFISSISSISILASVLSIVTWCVESIMMAAACSLA